MRILSLMAVLAVGNLALAQAPVKLKMSDFPAEKQKELKALGFNDSWTLTINPPTAPVTSPAPQPAVRPNRILPLPYTPLPNLQNWIGGNVGSGVPNCFGST